MDEEVLVLLSFGTEPFEPEILVRRPRAAQ
jgi:hypothetical protein